METITITDYLNRKGITYRESGGQLITQCPFADCDKDRKPADWRFYLNKETSQYDCKRCGAQGNIVTLSKHLGDDLADIRIDQPVISSKKPRQQNAALTPEYVESLHLNLPDRIRSYLNGRGITNDIINQFQLGWGEFYGHFWITIPITDVNGQYSLLKLRKDPEDDKNTDKMKAYPPKGTQVEIYGWELLKGYSSFLVVCEGEFDRLLLLSNGIPAVTGTGGAKTFKTEWAPHFTKAEQVYVCYDRDEAGVTGSEKTLGMLLELDHENVFKIDLPDMGEGRKDVTDYFTVHGGNVDTFMKLARRVTKSEVSDRIKKIDHPFKPTTCSEWKETIITNFPDLMFPAEVCASIISQILIHEIANPFALVLVGAPSGGKTICVNFFDAIEELTYATDKFTPASFVSNASNVPREKLAELDLLPRLKNKTFLVRDLATLFSKRDDDLNECLGILTRVLDGEGLSTDTGIHGRRNLSGDYLFMMIAASTPLPNRLWKMMGSLGSRLFFYAMQSREKQVDELVAQLKTTAFKEKERACRNATRNLLYTLWDGNKEGIVWNREADPDEVIAVIARCAKLLAKLRGVISIWKEKRQDDGAIDFDYTPPVIENPDRISILFYNLCRGHAVLMGRHQIDVSDLRLIVELAVDSAPTTRADLFRVLIDNGGKMSTSQIETQLDCSKPIALKEMRTLEALGVCKVTELKTGMVGQPECQIELREDFEWFLSDECRQIRHVENTASDSVN